MTCTLEEKQNAEKSAEVHPIESENTIRNTIYSVGIDQRLNLKEQIAQTHGVDSEVMDTVKELEEFLSSPDPEQYAQAMKLRDKAENVLNQSANTSERAKARQMIGRSYKLLAFENRPEMRGFVGKIRRRIHNPQMSDEVALAMVNEGYIETLRQLSRERAPSIIAFAREYAQNHEMTLPAALLFGYGGSAYYALVDWMVQEKAHGMHRHGRQPHPLFSEKTNEAWRTAGKTGRWPTVVNNDGEEVLYDVPEDEGRLPVGVVNKLRELWRANPVLRYYTGTNRLSGEIPYHIIEDVVDMMIGRRFLPMGKTQRCRYDQIIEDANVKGVESFPAVYRDLFTNKDQLKPYWDKARKWLYDYSMLLWETQNEIWLAEGKRVPATGVVYKPAKTNRKKPVPKKKIPGTIYLNNGRYYWVVARKMNPKPLIDPKSKPKIPGNFLVDHGRYYWYVPQWIKRQRLVPGGEKFSTKDKATAERIALGMWNKIKKEDPKLAANVLARTRCQGLATKDKTIAEKVAARMWRQIKKNQPDLAAKIMTDNRPKAKDHWVAQIIADGKHRHVGSFNTRTEAEAAYAAEFKNTFRYPPGYNVQCIPKLDKVWPTWTEQKARLALMDKYPIMPVIGRPADMDELNPTVERMQKVDWLVKNCILVFDDNSPTALPDIAIQSRGQRWCAEIKKQGKRPVIKGSASIDRDTDRIRITVYGQSFSENQVLTEEIYHIIFEIIRHANPKNFESIKKWYSNRVKKGLDPTWHIHEAFAELMVKEEESPGSTDLPRRVVNYAQKAFSATNTVPDLIMEKIKH
ncbi:MAG: hypothetical protein H8D56_12945 [Planctomycetes bacterium]|nr:hypothetical protein [Planctomycetota bacterium]